MPLSGFDYEELTALAFSDGGFFAGDLGDASVDMPGFFRITTGGADTTVSQTNTADLIVGASFLAWLGRRRIRA